MATDVVDHTELTRAGDRLAWHAMPVSVAPDRIEVSAVAGFATRPAPVCTVALPGHRITGVVPSRSPDGQSLAWGQRDGIWRADAGGCGAPRLLIAGGSSADWGPAVRPRAVPAGMRAVPLGRLAPGRYRLRLVVTDAAGRRDMATLAFVVPPSPRRAGR